MARLVALLRGINLGSKRRIAMADLRELMADLGYEDVRTVLASGNVVFSGTRKGAREKLENALEERFGMKVDVVVKTMAELEAIVDADPFSGEVENPTRYFVVFLDSAPNTDSLDGVDFAPDAYKPGKHVIYAHCPGGMQDSKLMKALGKPGIGKNTATVRNWATVGKLLD
jgi:uncharacterized protein (DUF1697 family)